VQDTTAHFIFCDAELPRFKSSGMLRSCRPLNSYQSTRHNIPIYIWTFSNITVRSSRIAKNKTYFERRREFSGYFVVVVTM